MNFCLFSGFSATSFAPGVSSVEFDYLKGQVKEWKEKYETIRIKRQVKFTLKTIVQKNTSADCEANQLHASLKKIVLSLNKFAE